VDEANSNVVLAVEDGKTTAAAVVDNRRTDAPAIGAGDTADSSAGIVVADDGTDAVSAGITNSNAHSAMAVVNGSTDVTAVVLNAATVGAVVTAKDGKDATVAVSACGNKDASGAAVAAIEGADSGCRH
jgi:exosome complex RNA-binding protein Csl4